MKVRKVSIVDYDDINLFSVQLNSMVANGDKVVSSNAYYNGNTTMYYALVEQEFDVPDESDNS